MYVTSAERVEVLKQIGSSRLEMEYVWCGGFAAELIQIRRLSHWEFSKELSLQF